MKSYLLPFLLLAAACGSSFAAETKFRSDVVLVDGTRVQFLGSNPDGTANWVTEDGDLAPNVSYADALAMGGSEAQMRRFYSEATAAAEAKAKAARPNFTVGPCLGADCRGKALTGEAPVLKPGEKISKMPNGLVWVVDANGYPQTLIAVEPPTQTKNPNYDKPYATVSGMTGPPSGPPPAAPQISRSDPDAVVTGDGRLLQYKGTNPDGTTHWVSAAGEVFPHVFYTDAVASGATEAQLSRWYPKEAAAAH
jgi:hypothetical protein